MELRRLHGWWMVLMLGWALMSPAIAAPTKSHKSQKDADKGGELTAFKDIPALPDGPDKGCYAIVHRKSYDVRVVASNLVMYIYPKDKGECIDKPIEFSNRFVPVFSDIHYKNLIVFQGVRHLAPPTTNAAKLVITAVSDTGAVLLQTWKFADNKIEMEESLTGLLATNTSLMRTSFRWPQTHKFTPNIEKSEREKAVAGSGYTFRWHAGKSLFAMKTTTVPYASAMVGQNTCDWVENQGPWGAHKVIIKRKNNKGNLQLGVNGDPSPYSGLEMIFAAQPDPKTKKIEGAGLEIKIE